MKIYINEQGNLVIDGQNDIHEGTLDISECPSGTVVTGMVMKPK